MDGIWLFRSSFCLLGCRQLVGRGLVVVRSLVSFHLTMTGRLCHCRLPSFLPSHLPPGRRRRRWGRQGMMRWNGIGRTTDYGSSSFVVHLPSSKEKETAAEKGKTRRRRRRGRDWTRMGRGMIRKFFSAEIEAVRSFVRFVVGNTNSKWSRARAAEGGQWNGGSVSPLLTLCSDRSIGFISAVWSRCWLHGLNRL